MNKFNWLIFNTTHDIIYFLLGFFVAVLIWAVFGLMSSDTKGEKEE